ncbi:hypothetical protein EST38_g10812 [Candolleomyces aberdarensis]|uniref:Extracellular membrane protein CFEM domain-containing protein n=1 Tax=Candolleomyces aberdarensis TaxID=2316362 RepID=A0A4Q2D8R2_9AGAR|nr:hypothetical protein EST38_g10812 [Candolleomyces aberdarensis]
MVKLTILAVSMASILFASAPVLAQTPQQCVTPCQVISAIEACPDADTSCVCSPQLLEDAEACRKCVTDAKVETSSVPGYNEILRNHHSTVCREFITTTSTTASATSTAPTSSSTSNPANNGASTLKLSAGAIVSVAGLALGALL